jgi:16S rRNA (cytidine1402-2'-O)-methyltransferase
MSTTEPLKPALYIVATPIGNPDDITLRALNILKSATVIACEDTRVTGRLLAHYGFKASMFCYNDFSTERNREQLLEKIRQGSSVALVSDAGTPLISDPGYKLVIIAQEQGIPVITLPGPSSVIAALTVAGLPTNRFLFEGFLPARTAARTAALLPYKQLDATLVFFESARRLQETLKDMLTVLGNRPATVIRELTKQYEEIRRGTLAELIEAYASEGDPRGEIIIVVGPPENIALEEDMLTAQLTEALKSMSVKEAATAIAAATNFPKKFVYSRALEIIKAQQHTEDK